MMRWVLYPGGSRIPEAAGPDLRARSYLIMADVMVTDVGCDGVLIAHGDRAAGYALRVEAGRLVHDYVHAGLHSTVRADTSIPRGRWLQAAAQIEREGAGAAVRLLVDGRVVGRGRIPVLSKARMGLSGVDVGCDRGLTVGGYLPPARFCGRLRRIIIDAADDQEVDAGAVLELESALG